MTCCDKTQPLAFLWLSDPSRQIQISTSTQRTVTNEVQIVTKRIAMLQSYYIPWNEYFDMIALVVNSFFTTMCSSLAETGGTAIRSRLQMGCNGWVFPSNRRGNLISRFARRKSTVLNGLKCIGRLSSQTIHVRADNARKSFASMASCVHFLASPKRRHSSLISIPKGSWSRATSSRCISANTHVAGEVSPVTASSGKTAANASCSVVLYENGGR